MFDWVVWRGNAKSFFIGSLVYVYHITNENDQQSLMKFIDDSIQESVREKYPKALISREDYTNKEQVKKAWEATLTYMKDGRYGIDNNIAERNIRPLTVERKNSLFFGNHAKAEMSALYHTFIATCQMMGLSVLKYFKNLFAAIAAGRTDYENMLPMTLGVCKAV